MTEEVFDISLWQRALALYDKATANAEPLGRGKLMQYLGCSDRTAGNIAFALNNRSIINCNNDKFAIGKNEVELLNGDWHIPYHDKAAIMLMLKYARDHVGPTIITINGDFLDCYIISNFMKNPLRSRRLFDEFKLGVEWLEIIREMFPDAKIILMDGNHEERIARYILDKAPQLAELVDNLLPDKLELKRLNIKHYTAPFSIGKLWHIHGHEKPGGSYSPENILNVLIKYMFDHFVTFHYHRTQSKTFKRIGDRYWNTYSVGYLAGEMDYARLNKWQQGFAVCRYDEDGDFKFENKTIQNGVIY